MQEIKSAFGGGRSLPEKKFVCVFGAARSGTSVTAHMVKELGVYFGRDDEIILPRNGINPDGFFERNDVSCINSNLEAALGTDPSRFLELTADWEKRLEKFGPDISAIIHCLSREDICGFKNNSQSILYPVWDKYIKAAGFVPYYLQVVRRPEEVAASAYKVWKIPMEEAFCVWYFRHYAALSCNEYGIHKLIFFDDMMEKPAVIAADIAMWLGIDADITKAASIVKQRLRHNKQTNKQHGVMDEAYELLLAYDQACRAGEKEQANQLKAEFFCLADQVKSMVVNWSPSIGMNVQLFSSYGEEIYSGNADWQKDNDFLIRCTNVPVSNDRIKLQFSAQGVGHCYAAKYKKITMIADNGESCMCEVVKQPTVRDIRCIAEAMMPEGTKMLTITGQVDIRDYPVWFHAIRAAMPLSVRNMLRSSGLKK